MDSEYAACDITGANEPPFEFALMVDVRVISANSPGMRTVDAGYKALATDGGIPRVLAGMPPETEFLFMGDEHGALISSAGRLPGIAERVVLTASHATPPSTSTTPSRRPRRHPRRHLARRRPRPLPLTHKSAPTSLSRQSDPALSAYLSQPGKFRPRLLDQSPRSTQSFLSPVRR